MRDLESSLSAVSVARARRAGFGRALLWLVLACVCSPWARAEERARLLPPREGPEVNTLGVEADGTRRLVVYGMRARAHPDGSLEVSDELLPFAKNVQVLELPARFGPGFLFYVSASERTAIWRAATFTGRLVPFARLDFETERLITGFDRLYAQSRRNGEWLGIDATSGVGIERGSLPRSPNFGAMAFADAWFGVVELPIRGLVASFDAGGSWHPLGSNLQVTGVEGGEILLTTPDGRRRLGADGSFRPADSVAVAAGDAPAKRVMPEGPLGRDPLSLAVLRGVRLDADSAVVAAGGALSRVRLSDGRVLESRLRAVPDASDCVGLPLDKGQGFLCRLPEGKQRLYALEPPFGLKLLETYPSLRRVVSSGNGGLVLAGGCGTSVADGAETSVACVRPARSAPFEVSTPTGNERVIALGDGRAAKLTPPGPGVRGSLALVAAGGAEQRVALTMDAHDEASRALFERGFWLDAMVENKAHELSGWISGRGSFAGVRVGLDGRARLGPVRRGIERALLAGERALVIPSPAVAEQSIDGGASFTDVDLPPELEIETSKLGRLPAPVEQGCSELGCAFAGWLRVGWDGKGGSRPLPVAAAPPPTRPPQPGGGRWILRCTPTGEVSGPSSPSAPRAEVREGQAPWLGLFEQAPPARARDAVGFDVLGGGDMRAYAWGPKGVDFSRAGRFQVAVLDPFRIRGGVWNSLPSPSPWADAEQVAETFGYERASPTAWQIAVDPSGRAGVLSVTARGTTELFAVEENRALLPLGNATRQGMGTVLGAVRLGASYYVLAQEEQSSLRLYMLDSGQARLVGQYPDVAQGGRGVASVLVRSVRGDALGIWARGAGWFVFPVDARSGAVGSAIEISASELSRVPRSCAPDEEGYLLEGPVSLDPYAEFPGDGQARKTGARAFEGRFVVSEHGICVSALAARAERPIERPAPPRPSDRPKNPRVSLTLQDYAEGGRRWGFRCGD